MAELVGCLVTGGAGAIGAAAASRLSSAGMAVAVADVNFEHAQAIADRLPNGGHALALDLRSPSSCADVVAGAARRLGGLGVLVNAGGAAYASRFLEQDWLSWDDLFSLNVRGPAACMIAAARTMVQAGIGGAMVNVSSLAAKVGEPPLLAYCASKAALNSLTRSAAVALAPHGIRVNAVCPGLVRTDASARVTSQLAEIHGQSVESMERLRLARVPQARQGSAEEVAEAIAFLVSPAASLITGETLDLDGGFRAA